MSETKSIIECIPNFCVGQDPIAIEKISNAIMNVSGVSLKCVDTGFYANRSVFTFLGEDNAMFQAAYQAIKAATEVIDMRSHHGTHPRFGAVDVFPFVKITGIEEGQLIERVNKFAKNIAEEFKIPTFLYEKSQNLDYRKDLAKIRKGEYEGLEEKMKSEKWKPDFYPYFNPKLGGMTMGVRNILVAFNVNIDTKDVEIAKKIAEDIRWSGKMIDGVRLRGKCKGVKAIGWYIRDFDRVQVSMNIVDIVQSPIHVVYETCKIIAEKYGVQVTGSELIGCIPRVCIEEADRYYGMNSIEAMHMTEVKSFDIQRNVLDVDIFR